MRFLGLELPFFVAALALTGCARPTLDDLENGEDAAVIGGEDTGMVDPAKPTETEPDASDEGKEPPMRDAGITTPAVVVDADVPCSDSDGDKICDNKDNCPDKANPGQEDSNRDDVGDACSLSPVECDGAMVSTDTDLGSSTVSAVVIDGKEQTLARVKPGATFTIRVNVNVESCGTFGFPSMSLAIKDEGGDQCRPGGVCTSGTSFTLFNFTLTAPETPGLHYIVAGLSSSAIVCSGSSAPSADTPIAALCVSP